MSKTNSLFISISLTIISLFVVFHILVLWSDFIIPLIISLLISFAIIALTDFFKKFKIASGLSMILSIFTIALLIWLIWYLINSNINEVVKEIPKYQEKVTIIMINSFNYFWLEAPKDISNLFMNLDLSLVFSSLAKGLIDLFSSAGMIFFYVVFILLENRFFETKLDKVIKNTEKRERTKKIMNQIKNDIKAYFVIKFFISFWVWFLSYIVMRSFWLDFAEFWAFILFLFNFIPNVWSIIAVAFPIILSFVQFESLYMFVFLTVSLIWVQVLMWNVVEPKFMWSRLNLSPLVILLSLVFWGLLWWVAGMILSVPLMVMINIILSKFELTKPISIMISEKWELALDDFQKPTNKTKGLLAKIKKK